MEYLTIMMIIMMATLLLMLRVKYDAVVVDVDS